LNITAALVEYETITVFRPDFNASQSFWFHRLGIGIQAPGTLCDPRGFNVGDSFTTNYSLFNWNLVTIANDSSRSLVYKGTTLESCDITGVYMDAHMQTRSADLTAVITCDDVDGTEFIATTSFSVTLLSGKYSPPLLGAAPERFGLRNISREGQSRSRLLNRMLVLFIILDEPYKPLNRMQLARDDFTPRWDAILRANNQQYPIIISGNGFHPPCPASLGNDALCANTPPRFDINSTTIVYANASYAAYDGLDPISNTNQPLITYDSDLYRPVVNFAQTIIAAVRIDLGNPSPNNFFLNPSVLNVSLNSTFPANGLVNLSTSKLYEANARPNTTENQGTLPLTVEGPANIQIVYTCRFQQGKAPGSAFVSVLVATLSMFTTGWSLFMLLMAHLAGRGGQEQVGFSECLKNSLIYMVSLLTDRSRYISHCSVTGADVRLEIF
jgi:hypothetical protein